MTADQLRRAMFKQGVSVRTLAQMLGVSIRAVTYWRSGTVPVPTYVEALLRTAAHVPGRRRTVRVVRCLKCGRAASGKLLLAQDGLCAACHDAD